MHSFMFTCFWWVAHYMIPWLTHESLLICGLNIHCFTSLCDVRISKHCRFKGCKALMFLNLEKFFHIINEKCSFQMHWQQVLVKWSDAICYLGPYSHLQQDKLHFRRVVRSKGSWHVFIDLHRLYACIPVCRQIVPQVNSRHRACVSRKLSHHRGAKMEWAWVKETHPGCWNLRTSIKIYRL